MDPEEQYYTVNQVAKMLNAKPKSVRRYRTRKFDPLKMVSISGNPKKPQWRIAKTDLANWLQGQPDPRTDVWVKNFKFHAYL